MERVKILYVDDESSHLWIFKSTFEIEFDIFTATTGEQALELFRGEPGIAIVLSDQRMPGMSGVELMASIYHINPEPIRMLVTGYSDLEEIIQAVNVGHIFQYILKPWNVDTLRSSLYHARDMYLLARENRSLTSELSLKNRELQGLNDQLQDLNDKLAKDIQQRRKAEKELRQSREQIRELTREILRAQENERQRIALDLHDNVAQDLSSIKFILESMAVDMRGMPEADAQRQQVVAVLLKCIEFVRTLSHDLLPPSLAVLGLAEALEQFCREIGTAAGFTVSFQEHGMQQCDLPYEVSINLYRLVQEAVSNVRKHAGATSLVVNLQCENDRLTLTLTDNGGGFIPNTRVVEAAKEKRMGLRSMEERVGLLRGNLQITSSPGKGTTIKVEVPIRVPIV